MQQNPYQAPKVEAVISEPKCPPLWLFAIWVFLFLGAPFWGGLQALLICRKVNQSYPHTWFSAKLCR